MVFNGMTDTGIAPEELYSQPFRKGAVVEVSVLKLYPFDQIVDPMGKPQEHQENQE